MSIRKKMMGSMALVMTVFIITIVIINHNSKDLQILARTSIISYGLENSFAQIENNSLKFMVDRESISFYIKRFKSSRDNFEIFLEEFNNSDGKELLSTELQSKWDNINKLWDISKKSLNIIIENLEIIQDHKISSLFSTRSFTQILSDTSLLSKSDAYRKDYTYIRSIDEAISSIGTTTEILNKALSGTRNNLEVVVKEETKANSLFTIIALIIATISSFGFSILFSRHISSKIHQIKSILHQISQKNLAVEIDINSQDEFQELGEYVKDLINTLHEFINSAGHSVSKVTEIKDVLARETGESEVSLNKIHERVSDMENRFSVLDQDIERSTLDITTMDDEILKIVNFISDQSVAVSNSSTAIEQMTTSVSQIATLTAKRQASTQDLLSVVSRGGVTVENTFENIQQVSSELIHIKELVEVIKNVADQTNILSMNAAIESAHAGDAGKGFSVVADEIRSLSEYTSSNVKDINTAIMSISTRIESSLKASEESFTVFEQINRDVNDFSMAMTEISSSIEELAAGGVDVLNSTGRVSSLNDNVMEGAAHIKNQSAAIEKAMVSIKNISNDVSAFIVKISERTNSVLGSFKGINAVSVQSGERIADLSRRMDEFNL